MPAKTYKDQRDPRLADEQVAITKFLGMAPSQDPHDLEPGLAAVQVNCYSIHPGELRCRQGIKLVTFSS